MNSIPPTVSAENAHAAVSATLPASVVIEEQGLRDGLQTEPTLLTTAQKLHFIEQFVAAGVRRVQVCSFVNPERVPQMADAEALCAELTALARQPQYAGVVLSALVLNPKGLERAAKAGLRHVAISLSASDTHSRKNANVGLSEAQKQCAVMISTAKQMGLTVRAGIQSAFGCRYEGQISEQVVVSLAEQHLAAGADEIALADSTGMGNPLAVGRVMQAVLSLARASSQEKPVFLHLHDTEGKGLINLYAALQSGVRHFDTAVGGLGGCPFIKGATGNISTEDTVHLFDQLGIHTGIDARKIAACSRELSQLLGKDLPSKMHRLFERDDLQIV
jgi:hydroxymethylglutaryl-CoA lyase